MDDENIYDEKKLFTDYCPFDCPRKSQTAFFCMKRFFKVIERYCPLFHYTEEERNKVFKAMEELEEGIDGF